ncbi:MAG: hypothetical protein K9K30_00505 [Burkholderiaceae bacterium]|nr:hypothetical protein [Sulfuritalea sp.]MCF8173708.1 hypothetical protein [Burkholderiaceae bacterium]
MGKSTVRLLLDVPISLDGSACLLPPRQIRVGDRFQLKMPSISQISISARADRSKSHGDYVWPAKITFSFLIKAALVCSGAEVASGFRPTFLQLIGFIGLAKGRIDAA